MINFIDRPESYSCQIDWGRRGAVRAAARGDILVIVDVLSFSTSVVTAVNYGGLIYPCMESDNPEKLAEQIGGEVAVRREEVPGMGRFSLSPLTYIDIRPGTKVVVDSPNGATCSRYASQAAYVLAGCFLNVTAIANALSLIMEKENSGITIIACGEREKDRGGDGPIRWAVEDYLGAGAVISKLSCSKSPDSQVCEGAFLQFRDSIGQLIWDCPSGLELREKGFGEDIVHSVQIDNYKCAPIMVNGCFLNCDNINPA
jgi:2-phosphosulfolactate phosphatase